MACEIETLSYLLVVRQTTLCGHDCVGSGLSLSFFRQVKCTLFKNLNKFYECSIKHEFQTYFI